MDEHRKGESGFVVGCLVVVLLLAIVVTGAAGLWLVMRSSIEVRAQRAATFAKDVQVQMSRIEAEKIAAEQQETPEPEVK